MNPSSRRPLAAALLSAVAMSAPVANWSVAQTAPVEVAALQPPPPAVEASSGATPAAAPSAAPAAPAAAVTETVVAPAATAPAAPATAAVSGPSADELARAEEARLLRVEAEARDLRVAAQKQVEAGQYDAAAQSYDKAISALQPANPFTQPIILELEQLKNDIPLLRTDALIAANRFEDAKVALDAYAATNGETANVKTRRAALDKAKAARPLLPIEQVSPSFPKEQETLAAWLLRGRSQYVAGDLDNAEASFKRAELLDPENLEAKGFLVRIAQDRRNTSKLNREKTREQMLVEVTRGWQRPGVLVDGPEVKDATVDENPLNQKIGRITIPSVNFPNIELARVVATLSQISEEFDSTGIGSKGVNIVLLDNERRNPAVNISLRNLTLKRVLDFICQSVNYQYEVQADAIVIRPTGEQTGVANVETAFFPVSRAAVTRMIGAAGAAPRAAATAAPADPFGGGGATAPSAPTPSGEAGGIQTFLQSAGVDFMNVPGSALAYDGSQLIVTQTTRNIERIRNILNRYTDVKQVEIATRFMEVNEGALDELGFNWGTSQAAGDPVLLADGTFGQPNVRSFQTFAPNDRASVTTPSPGTNLRTLGQTVSGGGGASSVGGISNLGANSGVSFSVSAPTLPGIPDLGSSATSAANLVQRIGDFDVSAVIRALARKQGSDLLSEPKITVLSGNPATITVAQELSYPGNYSEAQSQVSSGGGGSLAGASAVAATITAATPSDFKQRNVGVELTVTPVVEEDDYSISLDLNPRVTEFEGFVEYGGQNVAVSGTLVVRTPSGIYQPIFSVRSVTTKATIWDGATVILGGLTREEVRRVNDKVPVLGDVPLVGRLFRSEGESSQKRNLLIFVTANLVSPGGSPKRQALRGVAPSSLFQNPTVVTPGGSAARRPSDK